MHILSAKSILPVGSAYWSILEIEGGLSLLTVIDESFLFYISAAL